MKIVNGGISIGNIWTILVTVLCLAVLWGSNQVKLEHVQKDVENLVESKADKDVIEIQYNHLSSEIAEIKEMLKGKK
jgi:hypothetical protein